MLQDYGVHPTCVRQVLSVQSRQEMHYDTCSKMSLTPSVFHDVSFGVRSLPKPTGGIKKYHRWNGASTRILADISEEMRKDNEQGRKSAVWISMPMRSVCGFPVESQAMVASDVLEIARGFGCRALVCAPKVTPCKASKYAVGLLDRCYPFRGTLADGRIVWSNHPVVRGEHQIGQLRQHYVRDNIDGAQSRIPISDICIEDVDSNHDGNDAGRLSAAIRKMHVNLGHPEPRALARAIRVSGGSDAAVAAAMSYKCETCTRLKEPVSSQPGKLNKYKDFGECVAVRSSLTNTASPRDWYSD